MKNNPEGKAVTSLELMPLVYILIVNYKNWQDTLECLSSIFHCNYPNYKVFVVDNHSQNDSLEQLMKWTDLQTTLNIRYRYFTGNEFNDAFEFEELNFIQSEVNNGFAAGNNLVLKKIIEHNAWIWLLNPDMIVQRDALTTLVSFAEAQALPSIIGTTVKFYDSPHSVQFYGGAKVNFHSATIDFVKKKKNISKIDFISGGSLFTHARSFAHLGLLPENYFLYWEETDWCFNARAKGYELLVCTQAICFDKVSATIGKNFLSDYYYTLNGLRFVDKYKSTKTSLAIFFSWLRVLKRVLQGRLERSRGVYKGIQMFLKEG